MTPKEVLTLIREKEVKAVDLRFVDFPGTWQHFTIPPHHLEESTFSDGVEGAWNSASQECEGHLAIKIRYKEGYFPVPPQDTLQDIRTDMMLKLIEAGIDVEAQHHEVATGGQCKIDMRFSPLVEMAD